MRTSISQNNRNSNLIFFLSEMKFVHSSQRFYTSKRAFCLHFGSIMASSFSAPDFFPFTLIFFPISAANRRLWWTYTANTYDPPLVHEILQYSHTRFLERTTWFSFSQFHLSAIFPWIVYTRGVFAMQKSRSVLAGYFFRPLLLSPTIRWWLKIAKKIIDPLVIDWPTEVESFVSADNGQLVGGISEKVI